MYDQTVNIYMPKNETITGYIKFNITSTIKEKIDQPA